MNEPVSTRVDIRRIDEERGPANHRLEPVRSDDPEVISLAQNILQVGLLHPLTLGRFKAPAGQPDLFVIAGRRRLAAIRIILVSYPDEFSNGTKIPVRIFEMDAKEAELVSVVENVERKTLSEAEHAVVFQRLRNAGWIVEAIAERFGKSKTTIYESLSIADACVPTVISALHAGPPLGITRTEALQFSKIDGDDQTRILGLLSDERKRSFHDGSISERVAKAQTALEKVRARRTTHGTTPAEDELKKASTPSAVRRPKATDVRILWEQTEKTLSRSPEKIPDLPRAEGFLLAMRYLHGEIDASIVRTTLVRPEPT